MPEWQTADLSGWQYDKKIINKNLTIGSHVVNLFLRELEVKNKTGKL